MHQGRVCLIYYLGDSNKKSFMLKYFDSMKTAHWDCSKAVLSALKIKDLDDILFYIFLILNEKKTKIAESEFFSY